MNNDIRKKARELDYKAVLMTDKIMSIIDTIEQNCIDLESDTAYVNAETLQVIGVAAAFLKTWILKALDDFDEIYGE